MICKVCGSKNKDNVIFCEKCGNFISLSDKELFNNYISNLNIEEKRELALQIDILKGEKRHIGLLFIEIKGNNKLEISDFFSPLKKHKAYPIHIHKKSAVFAFLDIKYPETSIIEASISANQILDLIEHLQAKHRNSNIFIKLFIDYKRVTIGSFTEQDSFNLQKEDTKLIQSYLLDIPYNTIVSTDFARLVTQKEIAYTNIESKRLFKVNSITSRIPVRKLEKDGLFGRAKELSYLIEALEKVNKGEPKVIKLIGKPGVGKRNLIDFFARTFSDNNKQYFLKVKAASSFKDEPFYIISEILSGLFQFYQF